MPMDLKQVTDVDLFFSHTKILILEGTPTIQKEEEESKSYIVGCKEIKKSSISLQRVN